MSLSGRFKFHFVSSDIFRFQYLTRLILFTLPLLTLMTTISSTLRSPSPKKQRKPRTESDSSTVSPCSREVRDLVRNSFRLNMNCMTRREQVLLQGWAATHAPRFG